MEDSYELTLVGLSHDEDDAAIILVDENCRDMSFNYHYLPHIFNSVMSFGDEDGLKGFSLLVPHEEKEVLIPRKIPSTNSRDSP